MSARSSKPKIQQPSQKQSASSVKLLPDTGIFFIGIYLVLHFLPNFGSVDVIGSQWLALSLLNILVLGFILVRRDYYLSAVAGIISASISIVYFVLVCWAAASYFYAVNPSEVLVNFARLFNTAIVFFNIAVLLWKRQDNFIIACHFLVFILLFESLNTLKIFFSGLYNTDFNELILSLKGNTGNKNIMAASLAIKLPFVFYVIFHSQKAFKSIASVTLLFSVFCIAIINARSTYVSVGASILIVLSFSLFMYYIKSERDKKYLFNLGYVLIPVIIAFLSAQFIVSEALSINQENGGGYGTVSNRIATIDISNESSGGRIGFWLNALDYVSQHPIFGCGLGNWKLVSIPYVKETTNELIVPYHAHNDFVEMTADLGIPGGILFVALFVILLIYFLRHWASTATIKFKLIVVFSFLALVPYFVDAFLNFPAERPATQILFSFIMASISVSYLNVKSSNVDFRKNVLSRILPFVFLLVLLPTAYITYLTYTSMKAQMILMRESNTDAKESTEVVASMLPKIPNISVTTLPIESMKARYYYRDKRYEEALALLDKGIKANPYIYYSEFLKAALYFSTDKIDSAYKYGKISFYNWPRASNYYRNYIAILGKQKDTAEIKNAFNTYVKYRNEPFAWNTFLMGMLQSKGRGDRRLLTLADSALKQFPGDTNIIQRRSEIISTMQAGSNSLIGSPNAAQEANSFYLEGSKLFAQKLYAAAAQKFIRAANLNPTNYAFLENAGLCYFANNQFDKAIFYFDKAINLGISTTGKSEYFKAVCLVNLGRKDEGCALANLAREKKYPDADTFIKSNCK